MGWWEWLASPGAGLMVLGVCVFLGLNEIAEALVLRNRDQ